MRWIHVSLWTAGVALFVGLVADIGLARLLGEATAVGWWIVPIGIVSGFEHYLHAIALRECFAPGRRPTRWRVFLAHLSGGAISFITPTASVGGEFARATLLSGTPLAEAFCGVTVDRLAWAVADLVPSFLGVIVILVYASLPNGVRVALLLGLGLTVAGIAVFFRLQRSGRMVTFLTGNRFVVRLGGRALAKKFAGTGREFDALVAASHRERPMDLWRATLLHLLGTSMAAVQFLLFLIATGHPHGLWIVIPAFLVGAAVDIVSFFVPARVGVQEASRELATSIVGLGTAPGLVFSLVLRVEQIFWTSAGLLVYGVLLSRNRRPRTHEKEDVARLLPGSNADILPPGFKRRR